MSGVLGDLSPKQEAALQQMRELFKDDKPTKRFPMDDYLFLRFLRARDFDVDKSAKMLRATLDFRKKIGADELLETYKQPEVIEKYYPVGYHGYDRDGCPVFVDRIGSIDFKTLIRCCRRDDFRRVKVYHAERLFELCEPQTAKLGKKIERLTAVMDMSGFGLKHLWRPGVALFTEITDIYESNYPETLNYVLVVNAPRIFPVAYNLVKPFLAEATRSKVKVLGSNWRQEIEEYISPENLPTFLGGACPSCESEGPGRCHRINDGGEVPKEYFIEIEMKE
eukprot:Opistho-1_new@3353